MDNLSTTSLFFSAMNANKRSFKWWLLWKLLLSVIWILSFMAWLADTFFPKVNWLEQRTFCIWKVSFRRAWAIRRAIILVADTSIWPNVCRHQALQAHWLLSLLGIAHEITVGFNRTPENSRIEGHVWCTVEGQFVSGYCHREEYTVVRRFSHSLKRRS